jgi:hypothetical protein
MKFTITLFLCILVSVLVIYIKMFVQEEIIPVGGGFADPYGVPAYGLGGFGAPTCCPVPCSPCCYPGVWI